VEPGNGVPGGLSYRLGGRKGPAPPPGGIDGIDGADGIDGSDGIDGADGNEG
jgi:hypothetical protein